MAASSDRRPTYHSVGGHDHHDDSWRTSSSESDDDDDHMTSSPPGHVISAPAPPPRQLSVTDLFTYQRPTTSSAHHVVDGHVTQRHWPEAEMDDAERRRSRRPPASSSFDDSAIDNQSTPSTSSAGSRAPRGGKTRSVAVVQCSPGDVTPTLVTSQTNMAVLRINESQAKRSRDPLSLTCEADRATVYQI